jgi:16S rRNA (cytidine1402-2'-O)-methyltransferase
MPAISDPGEDLVRAAYENGIEVESVPGPSAVITALALSGMPAGRFCFEGFLTTGKSGRREHLVKLKDETRTMIFYEAPHKLLATLEDMLKCFGDREISVVKEITKLHEDVMNTTLSEAISEFSAVSPKGEFVLIVKGAEERKEEEMTFSDAVEYAKKLIKEGNSPTFSAKQAAAMSEFKKSEIYSAILSDK